LRRENPVEGKKKKNSKVLGNQRGRYNMGAYQKKRGKTNGGGENGLKECREEWEGRRGDLP